MNLGASSASRSVKNLEASRRFYARLGFVPVAGCREENGSILGEGDQVVGVFQSLFERNTLTFNPGWDPQGNDTEAFTDVRQLREALGSSGVPLTTEVAPDTTGPGSIVVLDRDRNAVLIDRHR